MSIRSFFAIPLKSATIRRLADHADSLCGFELADQLRWSDSDSYHLTLCFLGDISLEQVAALELQAQQRLGAEPSLQVHLGSSGYLRVNDELSVVAAIADPQTALSKLQAQVAELVAEVGIDVDEADFRPHITLGRLPADAVAGTDQSWPGLDLLLLADSVVLYQSLPGESGSIYTPLFEIPLTDQVAESNDSDSSLAERC